MAGPPVPSWATPPAEAPLSLRFLAAQARAVAVQEIATFAPPSTGFTEPVLVRMADAPGASALEPLLAIEGDLRLAFAFDPADPRHAELPPWLARHGFALFHIDDRTETFRRLRGPAEIPPGWLYATRMARAVSGLFFVHSSEIGGAERSLLELLEELAGDHGVPCTLVVPGEGPLVAAARRTGAAILTDRRLGQWCQSTPPEPAEMARRMAEGTSALLALLPALRGIDPDLVYTQTMTLPWGATAAAWLGRPHLWSVCEYGQRDHDLHFARPFDQVLADIAAGGRILVPTARLGRALFPNVPTVAIARHIRLDPATVVEDRSHFQRPGARRIGLFGTMHEGKGQFDAILALAELVRRGYDAELLLAGRHEPVYVRALQLLARQFHVADRVVLRDHLHDPYGAMRGCEVLVVCSRAEAFGRVVAEGMLLGRPVIYPSGSGMAEFMTDGVTGLAYEPGDAMALAGRVAALLDDSAASAAMGQAARAQALARLTRDAYGGAVFRLMLKLRDEADPAPSLPRPIQAALLDLAEGRQDALELASGLRAETARLTARLAAVEAEAETNLLTAAAAMEEAETETDRLASRLTEVEEARAALLASASWRVMAPLRMIGARMPLLGRTARRFARRLRAWGAAARPPSDKSTSAPPAPASHECATVAFPAGRLAQWLWAVRRVRFMYYMANGRFPALFRPRRFTEKIQWRKLFGLDPAFASLSDKLASRDWVSARLGQGKQARLLWVGTDAAHIPFDALPMPCVLKSTHASGHVIMLTAESDRDEVRARATAWLEDRFGLNMVEPGYVPVPPRLIVEERLVAPDGGRPTEYRVMVFNGTARVVHVTDIDPNGRSRTLGFFDRAWEALPIFLFSTFRPPEVERPARLEELLGWAERVAAGLDFARVDVFDCGDRLMVGEITLYPWSGLLPFKDPAQDLALGAMWRLRWPLFRAVWALAFRRWAIKP
ncbi:glycosyltransferase [Roseococcus sp. YIM B11640]|uniref:glycosyltransferase n=1 Tax=Roseococcus sp. YIM B11640 TaxID=3133973 RepID=UPI003C7C181B